jgi:hypothetical protein
MKKPDPRPADREARIQRILREVEKKLRQSLPEPDQPLEQSERETQKLGRDIGEIIERENLASLDSGYLGSKTCCPCGSVARYVTDAPRQIVTLNGVRSLVRAHYYCSLCRTGFCPLDRRLGLGRSHNSVGVRALAARFSTYLPFAKAAEELEVVTGIHLSARTVEREAHAVGAALSQHWEAREQQLWAHGTPRPERVPAQLHVTMDGAYVFVGGEWKEAKSLAVYERCKEGGVARAQYYASLEGSVAFGRRARTVAAHAGVFHCRKVGVVADGADWIWQEAAKHFPHAVEILDFWHVLEHLWTVARAWMSEEAASEWIERQKEKLLANGVREVIGEIEAWEPRSEAGRDLKRRTVNYLRGHERRMQYQTFREEGYHIGSGVAEASCKQVIQARLKGSGMRWSPEGAAAMLQLRAAWCSTGRTDFVSAARQAASLS